MSKSRIFSIIFILMLICTGASARTVFIRNLDDVQNKINATNTKYVFSKKIDLKGYVLNIPQGSTIHIKKQICNGKIIGNNTSVRLSGSLSNIGFDGTFNIPKVSYKSFGTYESDTELLRAMFRLSLTGKSSTTLELEPKRMYNVHSANLEYAHAIYEFEDIANKTIVGNDAIINDLRTRKQIGYKTYDGVFLFSSCSDITIDGLHYQNLNEDYERVYNDDNSLRYEKGIENQIGYIGSSFVLLQRDCDRINIKSNIKGARYGVKVGDYSKFWLCGKYGVKNSTFDINASRTGYPVAIEIGDSLDVRVVSDTHHRAAYLCGVSNSKINVRARNIMIAPLHCLLSDTHYSDGDATLALYKSCYNLNVDVTDTGSEIVTNGDAYCVGFQTYNTDPFMQRKTSLTWKNINITISKETEAPLIGLFSFSRNFPSKENDPLAIVDVFENIHIIAGDPFISEKWAARVRISDVSVYRDVSFRVNAPYSNIICDNANQNEFDFSNSDISTLYYSGNVRMSKGNAKRTEKLNSTIGVKKHNLRIE